MTALTDIQDSNSRLKKNAIGVTGVVFAVVAMAAPLTAMATVAPIAIGFGNGVGSAGTFLLAGIVLAIFGVGYAAMSRHVVNSGAFYAYISAGLGRRAGLAAGFLAVFCYNFQVVFVFGLVGVFTKNILRDELGIDLPWWTLGGIGLIFALACALRGVDVSALVLGVALTLETALLIAFSIAVLVNHGFSAFTLSTFSPTTIFSGTPGVALAFAFLCFIGFEATAILGEEAKNPKRTVAVATYVAVAVITIIYVSTTWAVIASYGPEGVKDAAFTDPGNFMGEAMKRELGGWAAHAMNWLLMISLLAVFVAVHNMASRYIYSFARAGILPRALARTSHRSKTPRNACFTQATLVLVVIAIFAASGADPYLDMANVLGSLTALGIIFLQAAVSVAVVGFFRHRPGLSRFKTVVAPSFAAVALTSVGVLVISNFDLVTGKTSTVVANLPWVLGAIAILGVLVGTLRPSVGSPRDADEVSEAATASVR